MVRFEQSRKKVQVLNNHKILNDRLLQRLRLIGISGHLKRLLHIVAVFCIHNSPII